MHNYLLKKIWGPLSLWLLVLFSMSMVVAPDLYGASGPQNHKHNDLSQRGKTQRDIRRKKRKLTREKKALKKAKEELEKLKEKTLALKKENAEIEYALEEEKLKQLEEKCALKLENMFNRYQKLYNADLKYAREETNHDDSRIEATPPRKVIEGGKVVEVKPGEVIVLREKNHYTPFMPFGGIKKDDYLRYACASVVIAGVVLLALGVCKRKGRKPLRGVGKPAG